MRETGPPLNTPISRSAWLQLAAVVLSLFTFATTYFAYVSRHETGLPGTYVPLVVGGVSFFVLMCALGHLGSTSGSAQVRFLRAAAVALVELAVFVLLWLFLLLNSLGA